MRIEDISDIFKRMGRAAMRADRNPEDVKLIAVTKTVGLPLIKDAADDGLRLFGESRIQEARGKIERFAEIRNTERYEGIEWHLIGHLQKNKAKQAVELFDLVHSLDSAELAAEINMQAEKTGKIQRVLVQVKLSEEETKHGVAEGELLLLLDRVVAFKNLKLEGLMTIPPYFEDPEQARPYFRKLMEIKTRAEEAGFKLPELSMGMSDDFEVAIQEGATMVRIGSAIFGERGGVK